MSTSKINTVSLSKRNKSVRQSRRRTRLNASLAASTIGYSTVITVLGCQMQTQAFSSLPLCPRIRVSSETSITGLAYRDTDDEYSELGRRKVEKSTSSKPGLTPKGTMRSMLPKEVNAEPKEQQSIDEYLEFLDKRYNRLHCDEKKDKKGYTPWNWLFENRTLHQSQSQEDALFVLGLAELASSRLLQKHHIAHSKLPMSRTETECEAPIIDSKDMTQSKLEKNTTKKFGFQSRIRTDQVTKFHIYSFARPMALAVIQYLKQFSHFIGLKSLVLAKVHAYTLFVRIRTTFSLSLTIRTLLILPMLEIFLHKNFNKRSRLKA